MQRLQFWRFDIDATRALMSLKTHVEQSALEPSLLDLVYLRVSQLTACSDCVDTHAQDAIAHGLEQRVVNGVATWREAPFFTER